ncbi:hypothetical protein V6N00_03585 [Tersicoccus sp. MR15.9]|uniref:hypothetical protein n=1 Tax=Tersicoccus mangrovi TaxID=3121635 RepID=UPI002FE5AF09
MLELITRERLPDRIGEQPFGPHHLLGISEVGVAVPDVPAAVRTLAEVAGLTPFAGTESADFAAVGDDHGLLILAETGRAWLPTRDRRAAAAPLSVRLVAGSAEDPSGPHRDTGGTTCTARLGAATITVAAGCRPG